MAQPPARRDFLKTTTASLLLTPALRAAEKSLLFDPASAPSTITLYTESGVRTSGIDLTGLKLRCPNENPLRLHQRWSVTLPANLRILGDAWERSYGELAFRGLEPERILPWYVIATDGRTTHAFGVKTSPNAFCFWQLDQQGISLWCDLRNGGRGVQLGSREINIAEIVSHTYTDLSPFQASQHFCGLMSPTPRLPKAPIYGGNNWYYAYGKSSASDILQDSERIASVSTSRTNLPWMVIDDGWAPNATAGPWRNGNSQFPDMPKLAADMRKTGVQPGLWTRPLFTREPIKNPLRPFTLDPTIPEIADLMQEDLRTVISWGYQLVKHDFSTYDLLGRWGNHMGAEITDSDWNFHDRTRTNAEIIKDFYTLLRKAAGDTYLLGCNTVGHLSAGIFEAQRIGDDTSGRDWNRTRKMGINTLAFRLPQHNTFFAIDADCAGITTHVDWKWTKQWLDLLARSGTPLFISAAPDAFGPEQRAAVHDAFALASQIQKPAEPLDWLTTNQPENWLAQGKRLNYDWYGKSGVSPFST